MKFTSPVYSAASGSIAGITYSRNRGGMYARARAIPANPSTERQGIARENLATAVAAWTNNLTDVQRQSWASYAASTPMIDPLGAQIILSGQQMFIRTFTSRIIGGLPEVLDGPIMSGLGNTPQWSASPVADASTQRITGTVESVDVTADDFVNLYMSRPCPPSRTPAHEPWRWTGNAIGVVVGQNWVLDEVVAYPVTEGQLVRVTAVICWADGRVSAEAFRDVIVTA